MINSAGENYTLSLLGIINISFLVPKGKIIKKRYKNKNLACGKRKPS